MAEISKEDLKKLKTTSLKSRKSLSSKENFGRLTAPSQPLREFIAGLPKFYMAKDLVRVAQQLKHCRTHRLVRHFSVGSHVLKNGLSPYLFDFMEKGFITTLSVNGSALIHDFEIATIGATSEDVDDSIGEGQFGVSKETAEEINAATRIGSELGLGLGKAIGKWILERAPHAGDSLLAQAVRLDIPVTVHIAVGTDIIHIHPSFDAGLAASASYKDFLEFASSVSNLEGGIYLNIGSAVLLPEVFLKALSLVRNLGHTVNKFWAVNLDFIRHYRPRRNVLDRPTHQGGQAIEIIGPHEILIPLLHAAVVSLSDPSH